MRIIPRKSVSVSFQELWRATKTLFGGQLICGPEIELFERRFSQYSNVKYAISVCSARLGIRIIFEALGCIPGEKVIMSAYNFPVIPNMIRQIGLEPVFVDIDPATWNIDCRRIEKCIDERVKYLLVTHMFGQPCNMEPIIALTKKYSLKLIEDCAHACGSEYKGRKVGSFGEAGCFSFGTGKGLVTFGGGMITTNDEALYKKMKIALHNLSQPRKVEVMKNLVLGFTTSLCTKKIAYKFLVFPLNFIFAILEYDLEEFMDSVGMHNMNDCRARFANVQAAIGLEQLKKIESLNAQRIKNAQQLINNLRLFETLRFPSQIDNTKHVHLYFPVKTKHSLSLKKYLMINGIDVKISSQANCADAQLQVAEFYADEVIEVPNYPGLSSLDIEYIAMVIGRFFRYRHE